MARVETRGTRFVPHLNEFHSCVAVCDAGFKHAWQMRPRHEGVFHITARSINEEHIFRDDRDYVAGIHILGELSAE